MAFWFRNFNRVALSSGTLVVLLLFHNCSAPLSSFSSDGSHEKLENNGQGYTGKAFINIAKDGSCGTKSIRAVIERIGDKYYQTAKDCQSQAPVDVTAAVSAQAYNLNALVFTSALFESLDQSQTTYSDVVCRGRATTLYKGQLPFADVSMQPTGEFESPSGNPIYKGYAKTGVFDSAGVLIAMEEYEITRAVEIVNGPSALRLFVLSDSNPQAGTMNTLTIPRDRPDQASFQFLPQGGTTALAVQPMDCYQH